MSGKATPLYVVCSPARSDARILVSRLLTEFYVLGQRPVAAFDLCDESPQLADYLPHLTTIADINDIRDQIRIFERLIAKEEGAKIIDVSHRIFKNFFTTLQKIGFFEEARCHSIAPLILFVGDAHPRSPEIGATIRRWFPEAYLLPVYTDTKRIAISGPNTLAKERTTPTSLELPFLRSSLRTLIEGQNFSFVKFWQARPANLLDPSDDELLDWLTSVYFQFRDIEVSLGCEESWTQIATPASRRARIGQLTQERDTQPLSTILRNAELTMSQDMIGIPERISEFAPKKERRDAPAGQSDQHLITKLQKASPGLRTTEEISVFQSAIKQRQDRDAGS